ncbi:hypothetical protein ACWGB8_01560 [Kitasatospora sp. NPDC054939]
MFGRQRRENVRLQQQVADLSARLVRLNVALGAATTEGRMHFALAERVSNDRVAQAKELTASRLGHAASLVREGTWSSEAVDHAERLARALRACARYRAENAQLRPLAEQTRRLERENRQLHELLVQLQDRIDVYQRTSEERDWQPVPATAAT